MNNIKCICKWIHGSRDCWLLLLYCSDMGWRVKKAPAPMELSHARWGMPVAKCSVRGDKPLLAAWREDLFRVIMFVRRCWMSLYASSLVKTSAVFSVVRVWHVYTFAVNCICEMMMLCIYMFVAFNLSCVWCDPHCALDIGKKGWDRCPCKVSWPVLIFGARGFHEMHGLLLGTLPCKYQQQLWVTF